jgi:SOS-response transcriptional repressor LexA
MSTFKERLEKKMVELGVKPSDLARRSGLSRQRVSDILLHTERPRFDTIKRVADALGVPTAELTGYPVSPACYDVAIAPTVAIPLRGSVPAGYPADVTEQNMGQVECKKVLLAGVSRVSDVYALLITGSSLEGDGIHDGDIVAVDGNQKQPVNGKIYVVRLGHETAVRHVWKTNGKFRLSSSNGQFTDLEPDRFEILGRVIAAWHDRTY